MQKHVNLVDLVKSFPTNIFLQKSASIQPRTSHLIFIILSASRELIFTERSSPSRTLPSMYSHVALFRRKQRRLLLEKVIAWALKPTCSWRFFRRFFLAFLSATRAVARAERRGAQRSKRSRRRTMPTRTAATPRWCAEIAHLRTHFLSHARLVENCQRYMCFYAGIPAFFCFS